MNKYKTRTERIKSALIVLLLISAVVLGGVSGLFRGFFDDGALSSAISGLFDRGENEGPEESVKSEAAQPLSIVITNEAGGHYGVKYEVNKVESVYFRTRDTFREALGSANLPLATDQSVWQSALQEPSVYFEYLNPVRLSMLGEWYGTTLNGDWGDILVRRLCVTIDENGNNLYYQDVTSGNFYAASTVARGSLLVLTETYVENNAAFAFEIPGLASGKNPYLMLLPDIQSHPVLESKNPLVDEPSRIDALEGLGVSGHIIDSYTETSGTIVYVGKKDGKDFTVRLTGAGRVIYTLKDKAAGLPAMSEAEAVEAARKMVSDTIGEHCGDAKIYLAAITPSDGGYLLSFQYVAAGGRIYLAENGYAAQVTISDGAIEYMVLNFREYKITEEQLRLMPEIQAAAASDGEFVLNYSDQGADKVKPEWVELYA